MTGGADMNKMGHEVSKELEKAVQQHNEVIDKTKALIAEASGDYIDNLVEAITIVINKHHKNDGTFCSECAHLHELANRL